MRHLIVCLLAICATIAPASAETVTRETGHGVAKIAAVGDILWERAQFNGVPGVIVANAVRANWGSAETVDIPANSPLLIIRDRKLKACRERTSLRLGGFTSMGWDDCLIDKNEDGFFELVSFNEVGGSKPVNPPVAYRRELVPVNGAGGHSFRQTLTYLGKSGTEVRVSYREYADDMARPAFTEDLTLPAPETFPQTIRVKDVSLTIQAIDGAGLHYQIN
jgi:hypothetical protein